MKYSAQPSKDSSTSSVHNISKASAKSQQTAASTGTIEDMKKTLADEYFLQLKTQNFHWNVEGPLFFSLHKLFEEQYEEIAEYVDKSAEILRALKSPAPGSLQAFKKLSDVEECTEEKLSSTKMIDILTADHTTLAELYKARLETAENEEETSAVTLYEDLITFHEKAAWMIRSHLS
ncbi:DNA starvation/stationary phase protection protein [Bdellovibrio sp. SKB1291214]|uniref:Dps family protein n=1 Tax=Bdellovibrio sp. SKB1291214 TaxID=1732569 RepID=UPI000B51551F|nr:DNA starvation/stationary phase protection protein [Bdellovibrio sp. SKB1291214]UYL09507.1 DNA starvation/stationary phase protection protein [Bdellovibrio sp. SKB1291214]